MICTSMQLKILLPFRVFVETKGVSRMVVETAAGCFGLLPQRLDCVAAITPGILIYQINPAAELYVAVDDGILVKTGPQVLVSVRRAVGGTDLDELRHTVTQEFLALDEHERDVRTVMARLETGFLRRLATFQHG